MEAVQAELPAFGLAGRGFMQQQQQGEQARASCARGFLVYFLSTSACLLWLVHSVLQHGYVELSTPKSLSRGFDELTSAMAEDGLKLLDVLQRSEMAVFVLVNFMFSSYALAYLVTMAIFLGKLSPRESAALAERLTKFVVFKCVFVGALLTPDVTEIAVWLAWFAVVAYMRTFLGTARDRLESLMAAPRANMLAHARALALVVLITANDVAGCLALAGTAAAMTRTKVLLCAFDMAVILVEAVKTLVRYGVFAADSIASMREARQLARAATAAAAAGSGGRLPPAQEPQQQQQQQQADERDLKGQILYHTELISDVLVQTMTLAHYMHVWLLHGMSFHLIDCVLLLDMRAVSKALFRRLRGYAAYRSATHRLRHAFPDTVVPPEGEQEECTICMDHLQVAKQLPCGHKFHLVCLRQWMQQCGPDNFTCPNCRQPLLVADKPRSLLEWGPLGAALRLRRRLVARVDALLLQWLQWCVDRLLHSTAVQEAMAGGPYGGQQHRRRHHHHHHRHGHHHQHHQHYEGGDAGGVRRRHRGAAGDPLAEGSGESPGPRELEPADDAAAAAAGAAAAPGGAAAGGRWGRLLASPVRLGTLFRGAAGPLPSSRGGDAPQEHEDTDTDAFTDEEEEEDEEEEGEDLTAQVDSEEEETSMGTSSGDSEDDMAADDDAPAAVAAAAAAAAAQQLPGSSMGAGHAPAPSAAGAASRRAGGDGAGPSSRVMMMPPPAPELSTWSGDTMHRVAVAVQRTLRSSLAQGGGSLGAVAGHMGADDGEEVTSTRRRGTGSARRGGAGAARPPLAPAARGQRAAGGSAGTRA